MIDDVIRVKIKSNIDQCPLCRRVHDNENMFCIINARNQLIELRCFRKGPKARGLKLTFQGTQHITEYDVSSGVIYENAI